MTRSGLHVDRTACAWLIRRQIDQSAEFVFVPASTDPGTVEGHTFDMRSAEFTHVHGRCTFEVMLDKYGIADAALTEMGKIIRDADVPARGRRQSEAAGLDAIIRGFQLAVKDDQEKIRLTSPLYDALYTYCVEKVRDKPRSQATPRPRLRYRQRFIAHLDDSSEVSRD